MMIMRVKKAKKQALANNLKPEKKIEKNVNSV